MGSMSLDGTMPSPGKLGSGVLRTHVHMSLWPKSSTHMCVHECVASGFYTHVYMSVWPQDSTHVCVHECVASGLYTHVYMSVWPQGSTHTCT